MKKIKYRRLKVLSLILSVIMLMCSVPVTAVAATVEPTEIAEDDGYVYDVMVPEEIELEATEIAQITEVESLREECLQTFLDICSDLFVCDHLWHCYRIERLNGQALFCLSHVWDLPRSSCLAQEGAGVQLFLFAFDDLDLDGLLSLRVACFWCHSKKSRSQSLALVD